MANIKNVLNGLLTIALIAGTTALGVATEGFTINPFEVKQEESNENNEQLVITGESANNIQYSVMTLADSSLSTKTIIYSVDPAPVDNLEIEYKIAYKDNSSVASDVLTITHDKELKTINVDCNKSFTKTIILTLYAVNDDSIYANINIDYLERVNCSATLSTEENSPISANYEFEVVEAGSLAVDRTITNESISFTHAFVEKAQTLLKERTWANIDSFTGEDEDFTYTTSRYGCYYYNLDRQEMNNGDLGGEINDEEFFYLKTIFNYKDSYALTTQSFNAVDFLKNTGFEVSGLYWKTYYKTTGELESGDDSVYSEDIKVFVSLYDLVADEFNQLFNDEFSVFSLTYTFNQRIFQNSYSLKFDNEIFTPSINVNDSSIVF